MTVFPWSRKSSTEDDAESSSNFSRHSSLRGTHKGKDNHFAKYCPVSATQNGGTIYALSLMSSGHGWAPWKVIGVKNRSPKHFEQGVTIGDVGYLDNFGRFSYLFNIFYPLDDPIQTEDVPKKFTPIEPPLSEWKILTTPNHFPPGAVIASEGIQNSPTPESPQARKIWFTSSAREGAVVVLPTGASREDLVDPSTKLHPYLKEHAIDWYQSRNLYSGSDNILPSPPGMNGTLLVVTGCDRATSRAAALFSTDSSKRDSLHQFEYDETKPLWWAPGDTAVRTDALRESFAPGTRYSVFIRGITIALGVPSWLRNLPYIPPEEVPICVAPAKPLFCPQDRSRRLLEWLNGLDRLSLPSASEVMFHPAMVLVQLLIDGAPTVDVALVEDSIWCRMVGSRNLTHPQIVELMKKVIECYDLSVVDGVATLISRPDEPVTTPPSHLARLLQYLHLGNKQPMSPFQKRASHTLSKILYKPYSR